MQQSELLEWNILLASSGRSSKSWKRTVETGLGRVGLIERDIYPKPQNDESRYSIRRLVSPADEVRDLSEDEKARALEETIRLWSVSTRKNKSPEPPAEVAGRAIRTVRPSTRGLLLIYPLDGTVAGLAQQPPVMGIAISFPKSPTAAEIEYKVNNIFTEAGDYDSL
jgi:hypothetical protein